MQITLTKAQRNLARAAATDESRPVLTCLVVGKGWVAAADGLMLARMRHPFKGKGVLFPAKFIKRFARCGDVAFTVGPKHISGFDGEYTLTVDRPSGTYPNHNLAFAGMGKAKAHIAMNNDLLKRSIDTLGNLTCGGVVRVYVHGAMDAIRIVGIPDGDWADPDDAPRIEIAAMPMFVNW